MCLFKQFNIRQHSSTPNLAARKHSHPPPKKNRSFALRHGTSSSSSSRQCRDFLAVEEAKVFTRRFMAKSRRGVRSFWKFVLWCEVMWKSEVLVGCLGDVKNHERTLGKMKEIASKVWVLLYVLFGCFDGGLRFLTEPWYWLVAKHGTKQKKKSMRIILSRM